MTLAIKNGVIAGLAGLVVGACFIVAVAPICGPAAAVLVGVLAGHFTARKAGLSTRRQRAGWGALAGAIAGSFVFLAIALTGLSQTGDFVQAAQQGIPAEVGAQSERGVLVALSAIFAASIWLFVGLAGIGASTLAGASAGYWTVSADAHASPAYAGSSAPVARVAPSIWIPSIKFGAVIAGLTSVVPLAVWNYGGATFGEFVQILVISVLLYGGTATLLAAAVIWAWRNLVTR